MIQIFFKVSFSPNCFIAPPTFVAMIQCGYLFLSISHQWKYDVTIWRLFLLSNQSRDCDLMLSMRLLCANLSQNMGDEGSLVQLGMLSTLLSVFTCSVKAFF